MKCIVGNQILEEAEARVSPFDRGYLFADGIYEVIAVVEGKFLDAEKHWSRLVRSCGEIQLTLPMPLSELKALINRLAFENKLDEGRVYFQITRGVADRDFAFSDDLKSQLFAFTRQVELVNAPAAKTGIAAITTEDLRWKRRDIKSIALLPQALAKQKAKEAGAGEAIMVEDGYITEGSSSSIYMIKDGVLITRALSHEILPGVTRDTLLELAEKLGLKIDIRPISKDEAMTSDEMFLTSAGALVQSIVELDGKKIADGMVGPWAKKLRESYITAAIASGDAITC